MTPSDYKGKEVIHLPTGVTFVVTGGQKRKGNWFLKDAAQHLYLIDECSLAQHNDSDLNHLCDTRSLGDLTSFFESVGNERFAAAWTELEKDPVEAATVALFYCSNWDEFCAMTDGYGVSQSLSTELNQRFRQRIKEKNLDGFIKDLYARKAA